MSQFKVDMGDILITPQDIMGCPAALIIENRLKKRLYISSFNVYVFGISYTLRDDKMRKNVVIDDALMEY